MFSRSLLAGAALAAAAYAGPSLTTIQDVLYKADGTRFNGTLTISWSSFQAADRSTIVTQSTVVKVLDGNLRVQLVPVTTADPPATYSVTYNSDGRVQFRETWSVPTSAQPLRVRDVRVASGASTGATGSVGADTAISESAVVGLLADLGSRPVKGPGFAAGRVLVVDSAGMLESVAGTASDCLRVDGSSGPCGSGSAVSFVDGEAPSGIVDGSNATFTLSALPDPASSLAVYRNGLLQKPGSDFTPGGQTIQFVAAAVPQPGDTLLATYRVGGSAPAAQAYSAPQVLCSGAGAAASSSLASVGSCAIPAGVLAPGDRVDIRLDLDHQGTAGAFSFEVRWGSTVALHRDVAASETAATGRIDGAILPSSALLSAQSWGAALPFGAATANAPDAYGNGLTVDFRASSTPGDTVTLRSYSVVRIP